MKAEEKKMNWEVDRIELSGQSAKSVSAFSIQKEYFDRTVLLRYRRNN